MTHNEKKILALILKNGPMSKRMIQKRAKLSWSTVVKMVTRLLDNKLLVEQGIEIKKNVQGKDAVLYDLSSNYPLILSVDVEYSKTQILMTNLKKEEKASKEIKTPKLTGLEAVSHFLVNEIKDFLNEANIPKDSLEGIGICIPLFIVKNSDEYFYEVLESELSNHLDLLVKTSSPSQAYAYYQLQRVFERKNCIVLVNRGGLGGGIILDGKLYTGEKRLAGEIGHIPLPGNPKTCQCGKTGCVETLITSQEIYKRIQTELMGNKVFEEPTAEELNKAIDTLVKTWETGNAGAGRIINDIVSVFAYVITMMITIVDIKEIYLAGYFEENGKKLVPLIEEKVRKSLFIEKEIHITYEEFNEQGFLKIGPAHSVFEQYFEI